MSAAESFAATGQEMFVDGSWGPSRSGETYEAVSPATGEVIGTVAQGDRDDARAAIEAAGRAAEAWAGLTAFDRAARMHAVGDAIEARRDELARTLTLDQGKPLAAEAYGEVEELVDYWRMAAEDAKRLGGDLPNSFSPGKRVMLLRRPIGVVGVISPWNWPYTMPAEVIAPALAAGNAVVWVPAPTTSVAAVKLAECVAAADLPAGVFNMVTGHGALVGDEVAGSVDTHAVGFIGSISTGYKVAERAAGKSLLLEMGGNGPVVVLEDADLDKAVAATLVASFLCAGQSCTAGERFLVHESVHDAYLDKLAAAIAKEIRLGDPFADDTTMGPLNNEPVAEKMDRHISDAVERGAEVVSGGSRADGYPTGLYYEPTVLARVTHDMEVSTEETFGPIVPISTIAGEDEALALIDASPYGLLTSVFTQDLRRGLRFAESARAGWVNVNESSNYWESHLPFGGRAGSRSGIGRVGGRHPFETFTETKTVIVEI